MVDIRVCFFLLGGAKRQLFLILRKERGNGFVLRKCKFLSCTEKKILIKPVAQVILSYYMSIFLLPLSLGKEIQWMLNFSWWGTSGQNRRGIHWMSWDRMCVSKEAIGMGFRNLHCFNLAMLSRQRWRIPLDSSSFISQFFKAKYLPVGDFLNAEVGANPSFI